MKGNFLKRTAIGMTAIISALTVMTPAIPVVAQENRNVEISENIFPDETFRKYVSEKIDKDKNKSLSESEITAVTVIDIATGNNWMYKGSKNLTGIEVFTGLTTLRCGGSQVTSLDLSKNTALAYLKCNETPLTSLDLSKNTELKELTCHGTQITSLDLSENTVLEKVLCYNTPLTSLDVSGCEKLKSLNVENTGLTYLDVSKNTALSTLYAEGSPMYAISTGGNGSITLEMATDMEITVPADSFDVVTHMPSLDVEKLKVTSGAVLNGSIMNGYEEGTPIVCVYRDGGVKITITLHLTVGQAEEKLAISEENFPDDKFRKYVSEKCDSDKDTYLSKQEIANVTTVKANNTTAYKGIEDLKGIEYFINLTELDVKNQNKISEINVASFPELKKLDCAYTNVSKLELSGNEKLEWLYCQNTGVTSLDVSANTALKQLSCQNTEVAALDLSKNTELTGIAVEGTRITSLDVTNNTKLTSINVKNTDIEYLDVSKQRLLERIDCTGAPIYGIVLAENNKFSKAGKIAGNTYSFEVPAGNFKLKDFFAKADVSRIEVISGAKITDGVVSEYTGEEPVVCKFVAGKNKLGKEVYVELTLNLTVKAVEGELEVNATNFPDKTFRKFITNKIDKNKNGYLSQQEMDAVTTIEFGVTYPGVADLTGLQCFKNLEKLYCYKSEIKNLDVSNNLELVELKCYEMPLSTLNLGNNAKLQKLYCYDTELTNLDISSNQGLMLVNCKNTKISSLDISKNLELEKLYIDDTEIESLDIASNKKIETVSFKNTKIKCFDASKNSSLRTVECDGSQAYAIAVADRSLNMAGLIGTTSVNAEVMSDSFGMSEIFPQIDVSKVAAVSGGTIENGVVSGYKEGTPLVYKYDLGKGASGKDIWIEVTLNLTVTLPETGLEINETNFPDEIFRKYVSDKCDLDKSGKLTDRELLAVTKIDISNGNNWMYKGAKDLTGIEYFTELKTLNCPGTKIESLDLSKNTALEFLQCNETALTALDVGKNTALKHLNCSSTNIAELNLRYNVMLEDVKCYNTNIQTLNVAENPKLTTLSAYNTEISEINLSKNTELEWLYIDDTQISYLDVSQNKKLKRVDCKNTPLYGMNVGDNGSLMLVNKTDSNIEITTPVPAEGFNLQEYLPEIVPSKIKVVSGAQLEGSIISSYTKDNPVVYEYNAGKDKNGNDVILKVTLMLTVEDVTVPPTVINHIPEICAKDVTIKVGDKFDALSGVTAEDAEDGDLTEQVTIYENNVDTTKAGSYEVTYSVNDKEGATGYKTIKVTVMKEDVNSDNSGDSTDSENSMNSDEKKPVDISQGDNNQKKAAKTSDSAQSGLMLILMGISAAVIITSFRKKEEKI